MFSLARRGHRAKRVSHPTGTRPRAIVAWSLISAAWVAGLGQYGHAQPIDPGQNTSTPTPAYLIGPSDVLTVLFWDSPEMSAEVLVRPDGHISMPLLDDIQAAGLTPEQLRDGIAAEAARFVADPTVTVIVREIHSRTVYLLGQVGRPGGYPLAMPLTVLHLLALGGGLNDFAKGNDIAILRVDETGATTLPFRYDDVTSKNDLSQNITLEPGDTVIVP